MAFQLGAGITGLVKQDELADFAKQRAKKSINFWQDQEVQWVWTDMQVFHRYFQFSLDFSNLFALQISHDFIGDFPQYYKHL